MKILVAGGAGYIGTELTKNLYMDNNVTVVDPLWFGCNLPCNIPIIQSRTKSLTYKDIMPYDIVLWLGGVSNDPMAEYDSYANFKENVAAPIHLAYITREAAVNSYPKRFVYASSCSIYGFTDSVERTEKDKAESIYPYGMSKYIAEQAIIDMTSDFFKPLCFRKATVCGWSARMRLDLLVNTMTKNAYQNNKINVFGPNLWRPNIDIRDVIRAYRKAIYLDLSTTGVFNIVNKNYQILELAEIVKSCFEKRNIEVVIEITEKQDKRNYKVNGDKAKEILGFVPKYSIADSVNNLLDMLLEKDIDVDEDKYYNINMLTRKDK